MGAFWHCLCALFARVGAESVGPGRFTPALHVEQLGKPFLSAFDFAKRRLERILNPNNPLRTIYMIGDNPESDIKGSNGAGEGWFSILVRSGCYQGKENSREHRAKYFCPNVKDAITFIMAREMKMSAR